MLSELSPNVTLDVVDTQLCYKELTFVAYKVASPLNESHISCFERSQLGNQAFVEELIYYASCKL